MVSIRKLLISYYCNCAQAVVDILAQTIDDNELQRKLSSIRRFVVPTWMHKRLKKWLAVFVLVLGITLLNTVFLTNVYAEEEMFYSYNVSPTEYPFACNGHEVYATDYSESWLTGRVKSVSIYQILNGEMLKVEEQNCSKMYIGMCNNQLYYFTSESNSFFDRLVSKTKIYRYENSSDLIKEIQHENHGAITRFTITELTNQAPLIVEKDTSANQCSLNISYAEKEEIVFSFDDVDIGVWHTFAVIKMANHVANDNEEYYIWDYSNEQLIAVQKKEIMEKLYRRGGIAKDGYIYYISDSGISKYSLEDGIDKSIALMDDINMFCIRGNELYVLNRGKHLYHILLTGEEIELLAEFALPFETHYIAISDRFIYYTSNPIYSSSITEVYFINREAAYL